MGKEVTSEVKGEVLVFRCPALRQECAGLLREICAVLKLPRVDAPVLCICESRSARIDD
jgi:hypothetical protein